MSEKGAKRDFEALLDVSEHWNVRNEAMMRYFEALCLTSVMSANIGMSERE